MLKISQVNNINPVKYVASVLNNKTVSNPVSNTKQSNYANVSGENIKAYIPSFTRVKRVNKNSKQNQIPTVEEQYKTVKSMVDRESLSKLNNLDKKGILMNNNSNDGSTVLENLYNIATKERIPGLNPSQIMSEVISALDNPFSITQKFGDIPQNVADEVIKKMTK